MTNQNLEHLQRQFKTGSVAATICACGLGLIPLVQIIGLIKSTLTSTQRSWLLLFVEASEIVFNILIAMSVYILSKILWDIYKGTPPFTEKNSERIKNMALMYFLCGGGSALPSAIRLMMDTETPNRMLAQPAFFIVAAILFAISEVFRYGHELQQEMDAIA